MKNSQNANISYKSHLSHQYWQNTTHIVLCVRLILLVNCLWKQMVVWAPAMLSVKTISILLVLLTRNNFAYFDRLRQTRTTPSCAGFGPCSNQQQHLSFSFSFWSSMNPEKLCLGWTLDSLAGRWYFLFFQRLLSSIVWTDFRLTREKNLWAAESWPCIIISEIQ